MISIDKISKYMKYTPISYAIICIIAIIIIIALLISIGYAITNFGFVVTPILTILLIIIWDGYNSKRKEESLVIAFETEVNFNIDALKNNCEMILKELNGFKEGQRVVNPLRPLNNEVWLLISSNTPNSMYKADILSKLAWIYYRVSDINENIRSRENYRIINVNMKNQNMMVITYNNMMITYDSSISTLTTTLIIF